jgi:hypothetical protein
MIGESIIPGERPITADEMRVIRDMAEAGRSAEDIAARIGNVEPIRIAAMIAPKRPAARKAWKGRRR